MVISRSLLPILFYLYIRHQVVASQLKDLRQHLTDRKHLDLIEPLVDRLLDRRARMLHHDKSHVLENLKIIDLQLLPAILPLLI